MFKKKTIAIHSLLIAALWLLSSCAGTHHQHQQVRFGQVKKTANPIEELRSFENDLIDARKNEFNVLTPVSFAKAEQHLKKAKAGIKRSNSKAEITLNIALGRAQLKSAEESYKVAKAFLSDVIKSRSLARKAGATKFENDYVSLEAKFLSLTRSAEANNLNWAKQNQAKVSEGFRQLELRAIKEQKLGEVRSLIETAERAGAPEISPVMLAFAKNALADADKFISEQRYQMEMIGKKADRALFMARRLHQIMQLSKKVQSMKPEQISVYIEGMIKKITSKLAATDMRNEPMDIQIENIIGSIGALQNDLQFMVQKSKQKQEKINAITAKNQIKVMNLNKKIAALEGKTKEEQATRNRLEAEKRAVEGRLAAERQFNQLYSEVQNYFEQDEAEVYKQGYQLVIRLKDIKFPVGEAVIMPENYQLLSKVQRSIRTFGEPNVTIEGHTDSTGSDAANEILSHERAGAVQEYLVANRTLTAEKIQSLGYGSQRPLASNATTEGRAINRRIDVVIKPTIKPGTGILSY